MDMNDIDNLFWKIRKLIVLKLITCSKPNSFFPFGKLLNRLVIYKASISTLFTGNDFFKISFKT